MYLPSDPRSKCLGERASVRVGFEEMQGQNMGTIRVTPGPLFMSPLGPWSGKALV